jgi:hypothetical protein
MSTAKLSTQSAAERRAAEEALDALVARFAPGYEKIVDAARRWVSKRLPTAYEIVYEYRSWFVLSYSPSDRGYEGVLGIRGDAEGIKLYFNQGKGLPDPEKLLKGSAQARWIAVENVSSLARPAVANLADEAIARNTVPFAATGRGPMVLRLKSAK